MRAYDPSRPLISLHIPKTAGMSLRSTLTDWFGPEKLHLHYRGDQGEAPERHNLQPGDCVHGHFNRLRGIGALDYYPDACQFITFLRDPFSRFVSLWRYLHFQKRHGVAVPALDDDPSFDTWFERRAEAAKGEDPFSFLAQLPWVTPPDNPSSIFENNFVTIGITENYLDSVRILATALSFPVPDDVIHINRADDKHRLGDPIDDFSKWRKRHEDVFHLEHEVYEIGCNFIKNAR